MYRGRNSYLNEAPLFCCFLLLSTLFTHHGKLIAIMEKYVSGEIRHQ